MSLYAEYIREREAGVSDIIENNLGFVVYSLLPGECFIKDIYVQPEFRKESYAERMITKVEIIAKRHGYNTLGALVDLTSPSYKDGFRLASKLGFVYKGRVDTAMIFHKEIQ